MCQDDPVLQAVSLWYVWRGGLQKCVCMTPSWFTRVTWCNQRRCRSSPNPSLPLQSYLWHPSARHPPRTSLSYVIRVTWPTHVRDVNQSNMWQNQSMWRVSFACDTYPQKAVLLLAPTRKHTRVFHHSPCPASLWSHDRTRFLETKAVWRLLVVFLNF